jgi:hypothetical protein
MTQRVRLAQLGVLSLMAALLVGCSSTPKVPAPEPELGVMLEESRTAQQAGDTAKALSVLHAATRAHPSAAAPWSRMAQIQFDAGNYGAAIVAAQEVLQRDTKDATANSLIAVSGLRASAMALQQLRQGDAVSGTTRTEAEGLARKIRESLGETVLVPAPAVTEAAAPAPKPTMPRRAASTPTPKPSTTTSPNPAVPAPAKKEASAAPRNPFGALQ